VDKKNAEAVVAYAIRGSSTVGGREARTLFLTDLAVDAHRGRAESHYFDGDTRRAFYPIEPVRGHKVALGITGRVVDDATVLDAVLKVGSAATPFPLRGQKMKDLAKYLLDIAEVDKDVARLH
jgi:hypothetical protein